MHPNHPNNQPRRKGKAPSTTLSAYEQQRQKNIDENTVKLDALGLGPNPTPQPKPRGKKRQWTQAAGPSKRQASRKAKTAGSAKLQRDANDDTLGSDREEDEQ